MDIALTKGELAVIAVAGIVMLAAVGMVGATVLSGDSNEQSAEQDPAPTGTPTATPQATPSNESVTPSADAEESRPVAVSLAEKMDERGMEGKVLIHPDSGAIYVEVGVGSAQEVKPTFYEVGMLYGEVLTEHSDYSRVLTIRSSGVYAQVSPDAARAYGEDRLKPEAFNQTVAIGSEESPTQESN